MARIQRRVGLRERERQRWGEREIEGKRGLVGSCTEDRESPHGL